MCERCELLEMEIDALRDRLKAAEEVIAVVKDAGLYADNRYDPTFSILAALAKYEGEVK